VLSADRQGLLSAGERVPVGSASVGIERRCLEVPVGGATLFLEITGPTAGGTIPVVLCHGAGGNHSIWFRQVAALAPHRTVVSWDHRGFGRSRAETGVGDPDVARADLGAVLDAAGVERTHVVAQSMGGWTALGFAIARPDRVASLTLADTVAGIGIDDVAANWGAYLERRRTAGDREGYADSFALGTRFVEEDPVGAALYQAIGSLNPELPQERLGAILTTTWPLDEIAAVRAPTLFVVGSEDDIFPPAVIERCAEVIPGAVVEQIPGTGHSPYFEAPALWNRVVSDFLTAHD
jgi:3-oxoadipate enol-lactonase